MATKRKSAVVDANHSKGKACKIGQKYLDSYSSYAGIGPSKKGTKYAHCSYCMIHCICNYDISITHSGKFDITRHMSTKSHLGNKQMSAVNTSITTFMPQHNLGAERSVIKAETLMTEFIIQMNLPLTTADILNRVVKQAFPDSKIANKYQCARSKCTAITKELSEMHKETIIQRMKSGPFCIATDGSNDQRDKQYPIVVTTRSESGTHIDLLAVPILQAAGTGQNIFNLLNHELMKRDISWQNCLSFGSDNANVMTGKHKGVFAYILQNQQSAYLSGCPCHLLHHAAEKAASALPFNIDEILVDTYYYLGKSSKRLGELETFQKLYDVDHTKILKHVQTRWLSISRCLDRIIENWVALKVFFVEQKTNTKDESSTYKVSKVTSLEAFYRSPTNKLYCLFLQFAIVPFDQLNATLQSEKLLIHQLRRLLHKLMREILIRFVLPRALHGKSVTQVSFEADLNHKQCDELIIGESARNFIAEKHANHLRDSWIAEFYDHVKKFFVNACSYIKKKLPLDDELLARAEVADLELRLHNPGRDLLYFLDRFPVLLPNGVTKEELLLEYASYQSHDLSHLQTDVPADAIWVQIAKLKDTQGVPIFPNLCSVMLGILTIPHSNAGCERIFSCIRKNKTDQRASLGSETLEALMVAKSAGSNLEDKFYSEEQLERLKSCYYKQINHK